METTSRTWAKALSWQLTGIVATSIIGYCFTGSLTAAVSLAGVSSLSGLLMFVVHEKLWQRVRWGRVYG